MNHNIEPQQYEQALVEMLRYEFKPPNFRVKGDVKIVGRFSKVKRQLDVVVYRANQSIPFFAADAKRHTRKIDVSRVECFLGQLEDVGIMIGLLTSPSGATAGAKRRALASSINLSVMSTDEARKMNWRTVARGLYPWDWTFHPQLAEGLFHLHEKHEPRLIIDSLEGIPFEEWSRFVTYGFENELPETEDFLRFVALHHYDDGWRFNAVQLLIEAGKLRTLDIKQILSSETDAAIIELLEENGI